MYRLTAQAFVKVETVSVREDLHKRFRPKVVCFDFLSSSSWIRLFQQLERFSFEKDMP